MYSRLETRCLYIFTVFACVSSFFLSNAAAQTQDGLAFGAVADNYTFETIEVPGIDFLALTASSDFGDYAGYTKSADGTKEVAFTLIGDVFTIYDFPGSENTYFYALGNNGNAAGYYEDSEGLHHGVVLENGELRQYDFPGSLETEIYGISDATGAMTGTLVGADGVRRGFTGEKIVEVPGAAATYADFINASGALLGTYTDTDGTFHRYMYTQDGEWLFFPIPNAEHLEYVFLHGITDAWIGVYRAKMPGDVLRTYVGNITEGLKELRVPGAVVTEGWNINQDTSVVGYYDTADGKRHGFAANPIDVDLPPTYADTEFNYVYETIEVPGVQFLAVAASSDYDDYAGYTKSGDSGKEIAFTLIDGVFETYDFPGSQKTHFYALGNNGNAAGYYVDSEGNHRGIVLENGELRPYDFPESVQTEIWGISDTTGGLTGNFVDAAGVRRGFSHNEIVEIPGAAATYADFVSPKGHMVGSYIDADGVYYPYWRNLRGSPLPFNIPDAESFEYYFVHGTTDGSVHLMRSKKVGDIPRTYVGQMLGGQHEMQVPGSVRTEGYNINADLSVVGHYETADGRIHSFVAKLASVDTDVVTDTAAQVNITSVAAPADSSYTFEKIDVEGVDFLAVTSSSDYEDYGGYTQLSDGKKIVAFTIIDDVFTTYDFPGSQETRFYALGNNGNAAGYYVDSEGRHQGVVLENGELRQYDFPDSVQTQIWGISDATGALTGNFTDDSGIRRGFSGDLIVEYPAAVETYADFVNSRRLMVGSYVDTDGVYHAYARLPDGRFVPINLENASTLEYFFVHGINDTGTIVARAKRMGAVPLTYIGSAHEGLEEFKLPGSVSTEGYNINQDGSIVGNYESADGRRYGFIASPVGDDQPVAQPTALTYTFESIDVPGVDYLALTASSDFEDYAGYTKSVDGEKTVGFTLINGVFTTYDFPGSQNTYFYALGNNGQAAGYYEDSAGLHHGVILEDGELRQYDYPGSVETEIYGISDATGVLTGNFIDASGIRRGFSGDTIVEAPDASATYADFVNASGRIVGTYIDAEGIPHAYVRTPDNRFTTIDDENAAAQEYYSLHGFSDAGIFVGRAKAVDGPPRTFVGTALHGLQDLHFPGSISTNGWNINQDSSVVGYYDTADGRRHGFIARLASQAEAESYKNVYTVSLSQGLNMISVPLAPAAPMTAKGLVELTGATTVIMLDAPTQRFVAWTPGAPDDGFAIEGGKGYIVNVSAAGDVAFTGTAWTDKTEAPAAPTLSTEMPQAAWAFVVSGHLAGKLTYDGYHVNVRNLRTNIRITTSVRGNYFAAATADLTRRSVVQAGDVMEVRIVAPDGNIESQTLRFKVKPTDLANAVLSVRLEGIGQPSQDLLLQNYPNPFNPETWIPYQLSEDSSVSISIYDTSGRLVRTLSLGFQSAGFYNSRSRAAYWDGRNALGERVASGIYFYQLTTPSFHQIKRMIILK